jgi:hypothetical protein
MVTISFRTIIFMQLMRRFKCSQENSVFFFLVLVKGWGFRERDLFCYPQFVLAVFPLSLQGVPSKFPNSSQYVSNSTTLLSHMLWPKLNFHKYRLQRQANGKHLCAFILERNQCFSKTLVMVNQMWFVKKEIYIFGVLCPSLINRGNNALKKRHQPRPKNGN